MKLLSGIIFKLTLLSIIGLTLLPHPAHAQVTDFVQHRSEMIQATFQKALFDSAKNDVTDDMSALIPLMAFLMVVNIFSMLYKSGPDRLLLEMAKMSFWAMVAACIMGGSFYKSTGFGKMFTKHELLCGTQFDYDGGVSLDRDMFNFVKYSADDFACALYKDDVNKRYNLAVSDMFLVLTDLVSIPEKCMVKAQSVSDEAGSQDLLGCIHEFSSKSPKDQLADKCGTGITGAACYMAEIVLMVRSFGIKVIIQLFLLIMQIFVQVVQFIMMFAMIIGVGGSLLMLKLIAPFLVMESVRGKVLHACKVPLAVAFYGFTQKTLIFFIAGLMNAVTNASLICFAQFGANGDVDAVLIIYFMVAMACLAVMAMQIVVILKVPKFALMLVNLSLHELVNIGGEMLKAAFAMSSAAGLAIATGGVGAVAGAAGNVGSSIAASGASWIGSRFGRPGGMMGMGPGGEPPGSGGGGTPLVNRTSGRARLSSYNKGNPGGGTGQGDSTDGGGIATGGEPQRPLSAFSPVQPFNGNEDRDIPKKKPASERAAKIKQAEADSAAEKAGNPTNPSVPASVIMAGPLSDGGGGVIIGEIDKETPDIVAKKTSVRTTAPTIAPATSLSDTESNKDYPAPSSDGSGIVPPTTTAPVASEDSGNNDGVPVNNLPVSDSGRQSRGGSSGRASRNSRARRGGSRRTSATRGAQEVQSGAIAATGSFSEFQSTKARFDKEDSPELKQQKKIEDAVYGTFGTSQGRKELAKSAAIGGARVLRSLVLDAMEGPGREMSTGSFSAGNSDVKDAFTKGQERYGEFREMVEGEERNRQLTTESWIEAANQTEGLTNSIMTDEEHEDMMLNLDGVISGVLDVKTENHILRKVEAGMRSPSMAQGDQLRAKYETAMEASSRFKEGREEIQQNSANFITTITFMAQKKELSNADVDALMEVLALPVGLEASKAYTQHKSRLGALMRAQLLKSSNVRIKK